MRVEDPAQACRLASLSLARARTYTPALQWMTRPVAELFEWIEDVNKLEKEAKQKKGKGRR